MTIVRMFDNKEIEIELTERELMDIFFAYQHEGHIQDIKAHWDDDNDTPCDDEMAENISDIFEHALDRDTTYWDAYWQTIDYAISEWKDRHPDPIHTDPTPTHKKYIMVFDMGHTVDGIEFEKEEDAKSDAINTLVEWICEEQRDWQIDENGTPHPTKEQIEKWDRMISDCSCGVREWNEETQSYDEDNEWYPSYEQEEEIGWMPWEELKKKYNW